MKKFIQIGINMKNRARVQTHPKRKSKSRTSSCCLTKVFLGSVGLCTLLACGAFATTFGANKPDLTTEYTSPPTPALDPSDGAASIRRAMAKKAIADARDAGFTFLRVPVTGHWPTNFGDSMDDLKRWRVDFESYWAAVDEMMDDLDSASVQIVPVFLWNASQFAAATKESIVTFLRDPASESRKMFAKFLIDFITRYKQRHTILFYEMANELNLFADIDLTYKCSGQSAHGCVWSTFTTADMINFSRDVAHLIKAADPTRGIASGHSVPRPAALHLSRRPASGPTKPDWKPDSRKEFKEYLLKVHEPFDIISVHLYPAREATGLGPTDGRQSRLLWDAAAAARLANKSLFVGEFGDDHPGVTNFMSEIRESLRANDVDYAAIWVWEFYQTSTHETFNTDATRYNVEPGYSDQVIKFLGARPMMVTQPRAILTWPLPCAEVNGVVDLTAVASSGAGRVTAVEFLVDGHLLATVDSPPYRTTFDPRGLGTRPAKIDVRAYSASRATATFTTMVRLNDDKSRCVAPP